MLLWVSSHIQETFKNKKEQIYLWAWQQLKFIFHKYLKTGSSPFAVTDAKVLNWQCKVYIASFVKEQSSIFLPYASPVFMHGWDEALSDSYYYYRLWIPCLAVMQNSKSALLNREL